MYMFVELTDAETKEPVSIRADRIVAVRSGRYYGASGGLPCCYVVVNCSGGDDTSFLVAEDHHTVMRLAQEAVKLSTTGA